jgi:hypothetical protein
MTAIFIQAAGRLRSGASDEEVAEYLASIETEHMGLGDAPGIRQRAEGAAGALNAYVAELRG